MLRRVRLAAQDPAQGYRLAGTLAVGQSYIAFLEMPDGGQVLVRTGSEVAGARVLEVTATGLRLGLASGVVELSLEGTGKPQVVASSAAVTAAKDDDKNRVYTREVSDEQLSRELAAPAAGTSSAKPAAAHASLVAAQRIAAVLDLPANSKVLRVGVARFPPRTRQSRNCSPPLARTRASSRSICRRRMAPAACT